MFSFISNRIGAGRSAQRQHQLAVAALIGCCLLWSLSGIVSRQLDYATSFETAFWRSLASIIVISVWLIFFGRPGWFKAMRDSGWPGLISSLMWAVMFTCFMIAITMTTVAKAMVTLAVAPLLAALLARVFLGVRIPARTWWAIAVAGAGIVWMVSDALHGDDNYPLSALGMLVAAGVPLASAINLIVMKQHQEHIDLVPAVLGGAVISCLICLPWSLPMMASSSDIAWLSFLGVFQMALPCVIFVVAARHLAPQETALISLLEVIFAPLWVWFGAGEQPAEATLWGGALVLAALIGNEMLASRKAPLLAS